MHTDSLVVGEDLAGHRDAPHALPGPVRVVINVPGGERQAKSDLQSDGDAGRYVRSTLDEGHAACVRMSAARQHEV